MNYFSNTGFRKISFGFIVIIVIALLNILISSAVIRRNKESAIRITNQINPYVESLEAFDQLITESKMYTTNWVYLPNSLGDKDSLRKIHAFHYPILKSRIESQVESLNRTSDGDTLRKIFTSFNRVLADQKNIMNTLVSFEDYEDPVTRFSAEDIIESNLLPSTLSLQKRLSVLINSNRAFAESMKDEMLESFRTLMIVLFITSGALFLMVLLATAFISRSITNPILAMKDMILKMGKGELPESKLATGEGVVAEMGQAVNSLTDSFSRSSKFADEIGRGNLSAHFEALGEKDMLGNALVNMRSSLKEYSENLEQQVEDRTKEVIEKSEKLEVAYIHIRESIQYAKHIQEAILPSFEFIKRTFPDSFIFYKPKDIVCGDFYWYATREDEAIIAAIDCTGHGVPGALMTVIGNSILNQVVNLASRLQPSAILSELDKRLLETMQQHGQVTTNDGMDVALCKYNSRTSTLTFAGAKRPLYHFRNGQLQIIKGDKFPIGSFQYEEKKEFTEVEIEVEKGDLVYLFSDGYQDQFGGIQGKKFMISKFREILSNITTMSMSEQARVLEEKLSEWQGIHEQTDDILVIGLRF